MKLVIASLMMAFSLSSYALVAAALGANTNIECEELGCLVLTTTSGPTLLVMDSPDTLNDDVMLELADEVTGESESTAQIEKTAEHFNTSMDAVVEAGNRLLDAEGLSYEGLKQELQ